MSRCDRITTCELPLPGHLTSAHFLLLETLDPVQQFLCIIPRGRFRTGKCIKYNSWVDYLRTWTQMLHHDISPWSPWNSPKESNGTTQLQISNQEFFHHANRYPFIPSSLFLIRSTYAFARVWQPTDGRKARRSAWSFSPYLFVRCGLLYKSTSL